MNRYSEDMSNVMTAGEVVERADILKGLHNVSDRKRIRSVMNGGAVGVQAVLNGSGGTPQQGRGSGHGADSSQMTDLPTANVMFSGLERLAQKIGRPPVLKTDMIPIKDSDKARKKAEKRARIVKGWDETTRIEMQYPQIGRWLPGYGYTLHVIKERKFGDTHYPVAELRDPYDVYPGTWGVDQQPSEVAIFRHVSQAHLKRIYPHAAEHFDVRMKGRAVGIPIIGESGNWAGNPHNPVTLIEYICGDGTYIVCPEVGAILDMIPNPLWGGPAFVMTKRFSFDQLQGQYHHVFGLMSMMAKLNILGLIGVEDSTFRETNIVGEMIGNVYERGRFAVNEFERGTTIEKPTSDQLQQTWQAINILERQFRVVAGYDVAQDGQSPNSFATGQGIKELGSAADMNVKEYQTAIKHSMELVDRKRLEWEDKMHPTAKKKVFWYEGGAPFEETYVPGKDIDKDYRTQRIYGAMATFDENSKIVAGLQLVQARIMDRRTMQENMDGFDNVSLMNERIDQDTAKQMLMESLGAKSSQGDPAADMALVEILDTPAKTTETLKKLFTPQEPQMSPEEMAMAQGGGGGGPGGELPAGPPPAVQTVLSQMESQGGGVQSVGQMR
jgi:hypothetical protein